MGSVAQSQMGSVAQLAERALRMREAPGSKPGVSRQIAPGRLDFSQTNYLLAPGCSESEDRQLFDLLQVALVILGKIDKRWHCLCLSQGN